MSLKSKLIKAAIIIGATYIGVKLYQKGKVIYQEALKELEKENPSDLSSHPLGKTIGEQAAHVAQALNEGQSTTDQSQTSAASASSGNDTNVVTDSAALQEHPEQPVAGVRLTGMGEDGGFVIAPVQQANEGGPSAPRSNAAAPGGQGSAGGADQAAEDSGDSKLPPVQN